MLQIVPIVRRVGIRADMLTALPFEAFLKHVRERWGIVKMTATDTNGNSIEVFALPKWLIYLFSGMSTLFMASFVPWATWVTVTLLTISVQMDGREKVENRVAVVEQKLIDHVSDPDLHYGAVKDITRQIDDLRRHVDALEKAKP